MSKFVTKPIEAVIGKQEFRQLVVLKESDDVEKINIEEQLGQWDSYRNNLEAKYDSSATRMLAIMNKVANNGSLPETQWKDVTPANEDVKEYEVKAGDLRSFAIKIPNGKLVILGGFKNQQKDDFRRFRSLKKQFLESIQNKKDEKKGTSKK